MEGDPPARAPLGGRPRLNVGSKRSPLPRRHLQIDRDPFVIVPRFLRGDKERFRNLQNKNWKDSGACLSLITLSNNFRFFAMSGYGCNGLPSLRAVSRIQA